MIRSRSAVLLLVVVSVTFACPDVAAQSLSGAFGRPKAHVVAPRPNIVLIMADDLGWGDLGCQGSTFILTPTLDALAADGARLTNFTAASTSCSPSRIGLLTGTSPTRLGFMRPSLITSRRGIPGDVITLPEVLRSAGYITGHVGKWHIGEDLGPTQAEFLPPGVGFDQSARLDIPAAQTHWNLPVILDEKVSVPETGHSTTVATEYALKFIDAHAGDAQPFFLNLWYYAPHLPMQAPQAWIDRYPGADPSDPWTVFAAMVTQMDDGIRQLLQRLEDHGIADNTLVLVTSDNGGAQNPGLHPDGNGGLKGSKSLLYEGGIRVPLLARWPGEIPPGTVNGSVTTMLDLLPTLGEVAGASLKPPGLEGRSLLPALRTSSAVPREGELFWSSKTSSKAVSPPSGILETFAVRQDLSARFGVDWKLVFDDEVTGLFDLSQDLAETTNLAASQPGKVKELWDAYWVDRRERATFAWQGMPSGQVMGLDGPAGAAQTAHLFSGGALSLLPDARFDMHDGHFSSVLNVRTDSVGAQVVMAKQGSFELSLDAANVLQLVVQDDGGGAAVLRSLDAFTPGVARDVAFTICRWPSPLTDNAVTLYVDGAVHDTGTVLAVTPNRNLVLIGNDALPPAGGRSFLGVVSDVEFALAALTREEVQGGWPAIP